MKKFYYILSLFSVLLFTSLSNYSYSFWSEDVIDKEEHEYDNEDDGGGTETEHNLRSKHISDLVEIQLPHLFAGTMVVRCCIPTTTDDKCDLSCETGHQYGCNVYRSSHSS